MVVLRRPRLPLLPPLGALLADVLMPGGGGSSRGRKGQTSSVVLVLKELRLGTRSLGKKSSWHKIVSEQQGSERSSRNKSRARTGEVVLSCGRGARPFASEEEQQARHGGGRIDPMLGCGRDKKNTPDLLCTADVNTSTRVAEKLSCTSFYLGFLLLLGLHLGQLLRRRPGDRSRSSGRGRRRTVVPLGTGNRGKAPGGHLHEG